MDNASSISPFIASGRGASFNLRTYEDPTGAAREVSSVGLDPVPLPSGLGTEAAGTVQEIGPGLTEVKVGDRIAYGKRGVAAWAQATAPILDSTRNCSMWCWPGR
jgi:hypothetical protein